MIQFPDLIRKYAAQTPGSRATHFEGRDFTWDQFNDRCHRMAQALLDLGVEQGGRVAFLGQNSHRLVETYFTPCMIGAIAVPINFRLSEAEMVELVADCTPTVLIVDRHFQDRAAALMGLCPSLEHLIFADWDAPAAPLPDGTLHYDSLLESTPPVPEDVYRARASQSDETMIIFYTSGTTGVPKGVMLAHSNLLINAAGSGHLYGFRQDDVLLLSGPMFHLGTGSRVYTALAYGAAMVIQSKFDVDETMALIGAQKITTMTLVPTMLGMILNHPRFDEFDFSSIRCLTYGASPMPITLMERALEVIPGIVFCQGYGMTETSPVLTILPPADHVPGNPMIGKLASVGKPMIYCDLRVVDENDNPVPTGQPGEVIVRGPQVMNGYWNRPDETAQAMRGGFYHTGDAGYLDEDGYLFLAGRTKEMIISGGENVYPIETENALSKHPAVAQCAVLGLPHPHWGEEVHAVVTLHDGASADVADLIAHCRDLIAHYKAPRGITIWPEALPLSPTNKIDKNSLRKALTEGKPT